MDFNNCSNPQNVGIIIRLYIIYNENHIAKKARYPKSTALFILMVKHSQTIKEKQKLHLRTTLKPAKVLPSLVHFVPETSNLILCSPNFAALSSVFMKLYWRSRWSSSNSLDLIWPRKYSRMLVRLLA
ncbi:hypothetical protein AMTRI_Chr04g251650 [Amborella trichopoda]